ncbi:DUF1266 domain-containing protein [Streptomyces sp. NPDC000410]|uniref:DUF1266 domain-containing protein n=1 Tax=Streptomyces sp. NPDC000410 TaxID=3154254 RepID=UPI0033322CDE
MQTAAEQEIPDEVHDEVFPSVPEPEDGSRWQAPTDLEQHLYKLSRSGNTYGYLRTLATEGVYYPVAMPAALAAGPGEYPMLTVDTPDGRVVAQVYTAGVLPRPHPALVYEFVTLGGLATILPEHVDVLVVNAQTPCEHFLLTDEDEREVWGDLHRELYDPDGYSDRVVTRRTGAPASHAHLHGLACGAHLCYANGDAWNTLDWHGTGYHGEVERIAESWGVNSREDWLGMQERLLGREVSPWVWDFVLGARSALIQAGHGHPVDPAAWRNCVESTLRDQFDETGSGFDEAVRKMRGLVGEVLRYEARFRADGLLPPDGYVRTVAAWDLGRASKMARWGRGARYATEAEMHEAVAAAGRAARAAYGSWEEFSAGYVLGRCLHFDEERFGSWYTEVLEAHRALTTDPDSPWLTVPFDLASDGSGGAQAAQC